MRAVVQRVNHARVRVDGETVGRIDRGLLVYVGVASTDTPADARKLAEKIACLRIFDDADGKLNLSVRDVGGGVLAIPNFTLQGDTRKGRRPSFVSAAPGPVSEPLHDAFVAALGTWVDWVAGGVFGAHMHVDSQADGPVNVIVDMPPR